jgi:hypothetical protein
LPGRPRGPTRRPYPDTPFPPNVARAWQVTDPRNWLRYHAGERDAVRASAVRAADILPASHAKPNELALSGLVFCAECDHVMVSMTAGRLRGPSFICREIATGGCGKMRISMDHLERFAMEQVYPVVDTRSAMPSADDDGDEERQLRAAISEDERRLERLEQEYDDEITKNE